jgi:hypothetical protein
MNSLITDESRLKTKATIFVYKGKAVHTSRFNRPELVETEVSTAENQSQKAERVHAELMTWRLMSQ